LGWRSAADRRLAVEPLEDRSLLSVSIGFPQAACANSAWADFGSINYYSRSQAASALVVAMPRTVQPGVPFMAQMAAVNAQGFVVNNVSDTISLSSSDTGTGVSLPASIKLRHGIATFQVTLVTPGSQSITATDTATGSTLTAKGSTTVAQRDVATHFVMYLLPSVRPGQAVTGQLVALDAYGYVVRSFSDSITFKSTDTATGASVPTGVKFYGGFATFQVTFVTPGAQTLTATDTATGSKLSVSAKTTVAQPDVATRLAVYLPQSVQPGMPVTGQLVALDASGRVVRNFSDSMSFSSTDNGTGVSLPTGVTFHGGIATFQVTFVTPGTQTLTAADTAAGSKLSGSATTVVSAIPAPTPTPTPTPGGNGNVTTTTSSNWSGYAVETTSSSSAFTSVTGTWTVPTAKGNGTAYASVWVGLDGSNSSTVEQLGTDSDLSGGTPTYYAWWEMYPNYSINVNNMTISPGDSMTASVSYAGSQFTLSIKDNTTGQSFSTTQTASNAKRSSAEWVVEAPSSNSGVLPLANFGSVTFSGASATLNGTTTGPINSASWQAYQINMASRGVTEDTTSALNASGNGFSVTYAQSASGSGFNAGQQNTTIGWWLPSLDSRVALRGSIA
jgi:hypothetical protein